MGTSASAVHAANRPEPQGYRHRAVVYRGDDGFVDALAPFVRQGIDRDEPTLVAVVQPKIDLLRRALGRRAASRTTVEFVDMADLGRNPAHIIPAWVDFVAAHDHQPMRGVGEPIWAGRRAAEVVECQLHEALLNVAVDATTPFDLRCPYDELALDVDVIDEAHRSHAHRSTPHHGRRHIERLFTAELPAAPDGALAVPFSASDLRPVRDAVRAGAADLAAEITDDLVLAVHEVATNSVVYGGGNGVLRLWDDRAAGAFVVEIADGGRIDDPLAGRLPPDPAHTGGRGLWLAHRMCDLVQVRSSATRGTTVRITTWR